ncbi:hypothetical protein [Kitasatospora sp. NPDC088779]|uniref:hypothetical protein n=1 Tax=Kitasatospora sp. NPDC088779 TaxID=3154964 RepID=UPI0034184EEE
MNTPPTPSEPADSGTETDETTVSNTDPGTESDPNTPGTETDETATDGEQDEAALPEWARSELAAVRREAAKYRTRAKEIKTALEAAKTPEEFERVTARVAELETELHRERLSRTYNLPQVFADLVQGDTDEEREAHAKALSTAYHQRGTGIGSGGLDPHTKPDPTDPAALAALVRRGRH